MADLEEVLIKREVEKKRQEPYAGPFSQQGASDSVREATAEGKSGEAKIASTKAKNKTVKQKDAGKKKVATY
jgi:uncharacterized low-complexity protein